MHGSLSKGLPLKTVASGIYSGKFSIEEVKSNGYNINSVLEIIEESTCRSSCLPY